MSQKIQTEERHSDERKIASREANRSGKGDHAFPMLSANMAAFPPEFRFMWASR